MATTKMLERVSQQKHDIQSKLVPILFPPLQNVVQKQGGKISPKIHYALHPELLRVLRNVWVGALPRFNLGSFDVLFGKGYM